ncbi:MAG: hypothetical protein KBI01_02535 [Oscillospiraceae bacterium]|nr:hypothetical protein [Oscillospiraceae bacterium]
MFQLITAFCAFTGGIVFGIAYDAAKSIRLRAKSTVCTAICDILICFFGLFLLFYLAMAPGKGEMRVYICVCAFVGSIVYFSLMSSVFMGIFTSFISIIVKILSIVRKPFAFIFKKLKYFAKFSKKLFHKMSFWYKMRFNNHQCTIKSLKPPKSWREDTNEVQEGQPYNENCHSRHNRICGNKLGVTQGSGVGRARGAGRIANSSRRRSPDKHRTSICDRPQHRP